MTETATTDESGNVTFRDRNGHVTGTQQNKINGTDIPGLRVAGSFLVQAEGVLVSPANTEYARIILELLVILCWCAGGARKDAHKDILTA